VYAQAAEANADYSLAGQLKEIPSTGIIPPGWYSISVMNTLLPGSPITDMMAPILAGCALKGPNDPKSGIYSTDGKTACQNSITLTKQNTQPNTPTPSPTIDGPIYNPNDINEIYHHNELDGYNKEKGHTAFNPVLSLLDPPPLYYEPGTYKVDSVGYVPNYADSLYLSTTTGISQTSPITQAPYLYGGFCKQNSQNKQAIDDKCRTLDKDVCASTECCVLLGGQKCVAGNERGPSIKNSYSDFTIVNRDFYYYSGKCYGNCPNDYFGPMELKGISESPKDSMILNEEKAYDKQFDNEYNQFMDETSNIYTSTNPPNLLNP